MAKTEILLEAGTNELEFIEFKIADTWYGLNVAKIKEIILMTESVSPVNIHPSVVGIFDHRGDVIPLIDLSIWLDRAGQNSESRSKNKILICELNNSKFGFIVHYVSSIKRISWSDLESPQTIIASSNAALTGVVKEPDRLILMLDVERIINEIEPASGFKNDEIPNTLGVDRGNKILFIADDSLLIRNTLKKSLTKSGYNNFQIFNDGADLWRKINEIKKEMHAGNKDYKQFIDGIITDIEMPQIDGMNLIRKIREDKNFADLPIIVFSSISDNQNKIKTEKLGATAHVAKPNVRRLIETLDHILQDK